MEEKDKNYIATEEYANNIMKICAWCYFEGYRVAEEDIQKRLFPEQDPDFDRFQKELTKKVNKLFSTGTF